MTNTTTASPARKTLLATAGKSGKASWVFDPSTIVKPAPYAGSRTRYTKGGVSFDAALLGDQWAMEFGYGDKARTLSLRGNILALITQSDDGKIFDDYHPHTNLLALVWDAVEQAPRFVHLASVSNEYPEGTLSVPFDATPDATPEVRKAYDTYLRTKAAPTLAKWRAESKCRKWESDTLTALNGLSTPTARGTTLKVVAGRKHPKGLVGKVFWTGTDSYGTEKVGLATSDRKDPATGRNLDVIFIAVRNCEAVLEGDAAIEAARLSALLARKDEFLKAATARELAAIVAEIDAGTFSPSNAVVYN